MFEHLRDSAGFQMANAVDIRHAIRTRCRPLQMLLQFARVSLVHDLPKALRHSLPFLHRHSGQFFDSRADKLETKVRPLAERSRRANDGPGC